MSNNIKQIADNILPELTKGRPFVFVMMPFNENWSIYEKIQKLIENKIGLACIRADDVNAAGYDLLEKIHLLIERAELTVLLLFNIYADTISLTWRISLA